MNSEEYRQKLKEEYKQDLKMRKEFLQKVEDAKRQQKLNNAVNGLTSEDDTDDWIRRLNEETALSEAKTEMALDVVTEEKAKIEAVQSEAELEKIRAQKLVEEMKRNLGLLPAEEAKTETETPQNPLNEAAKTPPIDRNLGDF